MTKLFRFTFKRAILSIPFLLAAVIAFGAGAYETLGYMGNFVDWKVEDTHLFDDSVSAVILAFVIAVLPAMLTGREFSSGTVRSKLITGTTKTQFFMTHLLVNSIVTVIMTLLYFLPTLISCPKYYNMFKPYMVIFAITCTALGYILISTISTVITVMNNKIIISIVAAAAVLFCFFLADKWLSNNLIQPKTIGTYETTTFRDEHGTFTESVEDGEETNPFYISGKTERSLMWLGRKLMPLTVIENGTAVLSGHFTSIDKVRSTRQETKQDSNYPVFYERNMTLFRAPIYTLCEIAAAAALGILLFKKRNIR